jgi:hypothetical protein
MDMSLGAAEHGNHVSPAMVDGKLIYSAHETLIAYDAKTGQEVWRNNTTETSKDWANTPGQPVIARIGDTNIIIAHKSLYLASDGTAIGRSYLDTTLSYAAPIVQSGVMYASARYRHNDQPASFIAVRLPPSAAPGAKAKVLWDPDGKDVSTPLRGKGFQIASPLCVDGIFYSIDMTGGLTTLDPAARKCLYRLWLDGYNRYNRAVFGVCASPTMAGKGKSVYIVDDAGYTHIIQPGPQYKEVARNVLENIHVSGQGGNPCKQESFYTSPWFEGKYMYLRGEEYLYCIGEK